MLLYFSVGGFCSFKDTQDLFLTSYSGTRLKNTKYENKSCVSLKEQNPPTEKYNSIITPLFYLFLLFYHYFKKR